MKDPGFNDFIEPLKEAAVTMHEVFLAFKSAGFTSTEAIQLIGEMTRSAFSSGLQPPPPPENPS